MKAKEVVEARLADFAEARARIEGKIKDKHPRSADYRARLAEYDASEAKLKAALKVVGDGADAAALQRAIASATA